jgi:hypothetical protein
MSEFAALVPFGQFLELPLFSAATLYLCERYLVYPQVGAYARPGHLAIIVIPWVHDFPVAATEQTLLLVTSRHLSSPKTAAGDWLESRRVARAVRECWSTQAPPAQTLQPEPVAELQTLAAGDAALPD